MDYYKVNKCLITLELDHSKYVSELLEKQIILKEKNTYTFSPIFIQELSLEISQISATTDKNKLDKQISPLCVSFSDQTKIAPLNMISTEYGSSQNEFDYNKNDLETKVHTFNSQIP